MPKSHERILCIDDDLDQCSLLAAALTRLGYHATSATSPSEALERVAETAFDVIITDLNMTEMDGAALCEQVLSMRPEVPIIVLTGHGSIETVADVLRAGAFDFLVKPLDAKLLSICVARALQHSELRAQLRRLRLELSSAPEARQLVGDSAVMRAVNTLVARVGASDAAVLICGETGTGKELVARALHAASSRRAGPFVALNCAAVQATLLESELFGHARGAFTDAVCARQGLFVEASGGTLFLDEIGELPLEMQAKLLRALQERKVRPVGANAEVAFDARILTATHRDLEADVEQRRFREDLYYRINVVTIDLPALRARGTDVLKLASHFLRSAAKRSDKGVLQLSPQFAARLLAYPWPGNVRELENCIERAVAMARFDHLTVEDLPEVIRAYRPESFFMKAGDTDEIMKLGELQRRYAARVITLMGGNSARAAQKLGIDRRTLARMMRASSAGATLPGEESELDAAGCDSAEADARTASEPSTMDA